MNNTTWDTTSPRRLGEKIEHLCAVVLSQSRVILDTGPTSKGRVPDLDSFDLRIAFAYSVESVLETIREPTVGSETVKNSMSLRSEDA